jgi:hypothetical protein
MSFSAALSLPARTRRTSRVWQGREEGKGRRDDPQIARIAANLLFHEGAEVRKTQNARYRAGQTIKAQQNMHLQSPP